jgi:hypothetical protein
MVAGPLFCFSSRGGYQKQAVTMLPVTASHREKTRAATIKNGYQAKYFDKQPPTLVYLHM